MSGLVSWIAGEPVTRWFAGPELLQAMGDQERLAAQSAWKSAETKNVAVAMALLGGWLGLGLGAAGGLARGSVRAGTMAGSVGLAAGAAAGTGATLSLMPLYFLDLAANPQATDLVVPLAIHAALWSCVGAAGGLALGIGLGGKSKAVPGLTGGLLGAVLGALIYEVVGALAFPLARTTRPLSITWESRLFARLVISLLVAAGAVSLCLAARKNTTGPPASDPDRP